MSVPALQIAPTAPPLYVHGALVYTQIGTEIARSLVKARAEIKNPHTDAENPHFHSRYASLAGVIEAVTPVLAKHGLCQWQELASEMLADSQGREAWNVACTTVIQHESGQQLRFPALKLPAQGSAQGVGGSATYARRYSLMAALGIAGDEDDDGESDRLARANAPQRTTVPRATTATRQQGQAGMLPPRPTGPFAYGKKYADMPWNVMFSNQLEWFRDQPNTPRAVREKCEAELAHRAHEASQLDMAQARRAQDDAANPISDDIPM